MESSGKPYKILMPGLPPENLECSIGMGILKSSPHDLIGQSRLGTAGEENGWSDSGKQTLLCFEIVRQEETHRDADLKVQ